MNVFRYVYLFLFHYSLLGCTAPAPAPSPSALLLPSNLTALIPVGGTSTISNGTILTLTDTVYRYRVPYTPTTLILSFIPEEPIQKAFLGRTILRTQEDIRVYIASHTSGAKIPLDEAYESDRRWTGCFFGVQPYPKDYRKLTYGIVGNVLEGLWWVTYREKRYVTTIFEVRDDKWGSVGRGKVSLRGDRVAVG